MVRKYRGVAAQEIAHVPNAVDPQMFRVNGKRKKLAVKGRKVAGYVGILNREIDMDLVRHLVYSFPEVDFLFIGAVDKERSGDMRELTEKCENIRYLGERYYLDVPAYLAGCDVLINVKRTDHTTAGGESQKFYEYLATGKPIVSTPFPPADQYADIVYVATSKERFVELLTIALKEDDPQLQEMRKNTAFENSWARRADVILGRVHSLLNDGHKSLGTGEHA